MEILFITAVSSEITGLQNFKDLEIKLERECVDMVKCLACKCNLVRVRPFCILEALSSVLLCFVFSCRQHHILTTEIT